MLSGLEDLGSMGLQVHRVQGARMLIRNNLRGLFCGSCVLDR